jgi:hypothetical protein
MQKSVLEKIVTQNEYRGTTKIGSRTAKIGFRGSELACSLQRSWNKFVLGIFL